ncbi:hypothetical protein B0H63DRAFT_445915 [Podospora didyma]|uniref:Uncharacterized protein n=1 Tax=Podospora didyma TaxID=330526 RepID=A0AAE0NY31_9PEZI|nr:hypothetical protein B0H63DRAFT_445915 [Podospora didyma]
MFVNTFLVAAMAALSTAAVVPTPTVTKFYPRSPAVTMVDCDLTGGTIPATLATAHGGALNPTPAHGPGVDDIPPPPPFMTVAFLNNAGVGLTTAHFINPKEGLPLLGDEPLWEGSFQNQGAIVKVDLDVSYVNGYSLPIVCTCNDDGRFLSGYDKQLWRMNPCPDDNGHGDNFIAPCAHIAYTYPNNSVPANSNGNCQFDQLTCKISPK